MHSLQASELIPSGFVVENLANDTECVVVAITASTASRPARFVQPRRFVFIAVTCAHLSTSRLEAGVRSWFSERDGFSATQVAVHDGFSQNVSMGL